MLIETNLERTPCEGMDWIDKAEEKVEWWVVNMVINLQVLPKAGNLLTS